MPELTNTFELNSADRHAREAVQRALAELDWDSWTEDGQTVARENPLGLCCSMAPVKAWISLRDIPPGRTQIVIDVSVPGFGPAPRRQLEDRSRGLEQRIRRWASARHDSGPQPVASSASWSAP